MKIFATVWKSIVDEFNTPIELDSDRVKRELQQNVNHEADTRASFVAGAIAAGFTEQQVQVMSRYLSMRTHQHQYYGTAHWECTLPLETGGAK